jgi:hypothetical protein
MVGLGIAESEIEKRRVGDLPDLDETKDEREQRDRQQQGPPQRRHRGGGRTQWGSDVGLDASHTQQRSR